MDDKTIELLTQEYWFLQKTIEDYDGRALTIKAWSITFSAAGLGLAYQQHNAMLLLLAAASAFVFWIIETAWKVHQHAFFPRIRALEEWFAATDAKPPPPHPLQIYDTWRQGMHGPSKIARWFGRMFCWTVQLPHVLITVVGILLFLLAPPPPEKAQDSLASTHVATK